METLLEPQIATPESGSWSTRRKALAFGTAAFAGLMLTSRKSLAQAAVTDTDIFNFALNLEFLEANFYSLALTGQPFGTSSGTTASGSGAAGGTVVYPPNPQVDFSADPLLNDFVTELTKTEAAHVAFIQSQLGSAAIAQPNIDLLNSFNAIGAAIGLGSFNAFANSTNFLLAAGVFEEIGVTAYQGAAPLLASKTNLSAALGIHNVEAYHAGAIRLRIYQAGATAQADSQALANFLATTDGSATSSTGADDIGVTTTSSGASTIVDADAATSRTFARTTTQVLTLAYGGNAPGTGGGFFPNGVNGNIK